ncbi:tyrosine-type recombinase/integrase [Nonomuraea dietziae]|uniref:tyrosine-type recombinase/integrase n=1 Tax=Nonomuraea dietziae TaxID=65515 RepID=UPI0033EB6DDD
MSKSAESGQRRTESGSPVSQGRSGARFRSCDRPRGHVHDGEQPGRTPAAPTWRLRQAREWRVDYASSPASTPEHLLWGWGHLRERRAYSGVRIAELIALDDDDVPLSARKGKVIVRSGKGETSREIPLLDGTVRASVTEWRTERASWPGAADNPALLLNHRGGRLSTRAVDQLIDELATDADGRRRPGGPRVPRPPVPGSRPLDGRTVPELHGPRRPRRP